MGAGHGRQRSRCLVIWQVAGSAGGHVLLPLGQRGATAVDLSSAIGGIDLRGSRFDERAAAEDIARSVVDSLSPTLEQVAVTILPAQNT